MATKQSSFINMVLALFLVTLISSAVLGLVYEATKEPIAQANLNKKLNAIKEVVPEFTNNPDADQFKIALAEGDSVTAYPAKKDGKLVGTAIESYTMKGFSGLIKIMVGLNPDGSIHGISVLQHQETPGLGSHMSDPGFKGQFIGKDPAKFKLIVKKDGGDVDAITAATISSRAFCDAVQRAYDAYMKSSSNQSAEATEASVQTEGGE